MMSSNVTELLKETAFSIVESPSNWQAFLETAAHNHKYSFVDQMMIFAQNPTASACASTEVWNKRLGRVVLDTATPIYLPPSGNNANGAVIFDVSDTTGKPVYLWAVRPETSDMLRSLLCEHHNLNSHLPLNSVLDELAQAAAANVYPKVLGDLLSMNAQISKDLLFNNEEGSATNSIKELLHTSIFYMLLSRCNLHPTDAIDAARFKIIPQFNTSEAISILGTSVSNASKALLNEISLIVKTLDKTVELNKDTVKEVVSDDERQESIRREVRSDEKDVPARSSRGTVHDHDDRGNLTEASDGNRGESAETDSAADGTDGREGGRERSPESAGSDEMGRPEEQHSEPSRGNRSGGDRLRLNNEDEEAVESHEFVEELLQFRPSLQHGTAESVIAFFEENAEEELRAEYLQNTVYSKGVFCEPTLADGTKAGFRALDEGLEVWAGGNAYPSATTKFVLNWGDVVSIIDRLIENGTFSATGDKLFPSTEEQELIIDESTVSFEISQADIDAVLTHGSGFQDGKYRIFEQYAQKHTPKENVAFLKNEYGVGGGTFFYPDHVRGSWDHGGKGISLSKTREFGKSNMLMSWDKVQKRIGELIAADRYLSPTEKAYYPTYCKEMQLHGERVEVSKEYQAIIREYNESLNESDNREAMLNLYVLLDCASALTQGHKKTYALSMKGDFVLPLIRDSLNEIIAANTSLTKRCEAMLISLDRDLFKALEPTAEELAADPEPELEYRLSPGNKVYLGVNEYEVISVSGDEVCLSDINFPLFTENYSLDDLQEQLRENGQNNYLLYEVEKDPSEDASEQENSDSSKNNIWDEYSKIKAEHANSIILYRVGDFFEIMGEDVKPVAEALELTETYRHVEEDERIPMCGFPAHVLQSYVKKLQNHFNSVVVADLKDGERTIDVLINQPEPDNVQTEVVDEPAKPKTSNAPSLLHPEISSADRRNYIISNDNLGVGTASERYANNVAAIRLLKVLEKENRLATPDEQDVLARYVGWGGLADCFDERNNKYNELKSLLTEDEYVAARESTLTAFYTPPVVIRAMYEALDNMNFKRGNILEPSCGTGNFIGMMPNHLADSKVYGVELDSISGRIAQQLYQNTSIAIQGYERTDLPDSFFDCAIGNVPFGQFKVPDKRYNKNNFLIHDYFFAKTLDKVRPGGIIAFITSKGTMDKENPAVRKYIAQRADLLGAIRLPNNTFKSAAGTEVTSDIIFLQKRDRVLDVEPDWVHLEYATDQETGEVLTYPDGECVEINTYFAEHPEMILGKTKVVSGPHGPEVTCNPHNSQSLEDLLQKAIQNVSGSITAYDVDIDDPIETGDIPADPTVRNFSFAEVDGSLYFRENSVMHPVQTNKTAEQRIRNLIELRQLVRTLIDAQLEDQSDEEIADIQKKLNETYDNFTAKYGLINSRGNSMAFSADSAYYLLCSLEHLDKEGNLERKADMFTKRTIRPVREQLVADSSIDALAISIGEKARVDLEYMRELTGFSFEKLIEDLRGSIFPNPMHLDENGVVLYETADEYLSGNVKEKLRIAKEFAQQNPEKYNFNVAALEKVQPEPLSASEINVRLGATWIPPEVYQEFMNHLLQPPSYYRDRIRIVYTPYTGSWDIENKNWDRWNLRAKEEYGTERRSAYDILEDTLNLKDVTVYDTVEDADGKKHRVINKDETTVAQQKQQAIKDAFADWVWQDHERRQMLVDIYNDKFNSTRLREFNGDHILFHGMNPEITLMKHQRDAIARVLYGGNTLLAHAVGAGKTYEMVAAAMESKRLGLCHKNMFVVPNHLTGQWATEFLRLYPSANILVATKKDFETKNRKKFCARIATGDYDAIIIGHSQFERIPLSTERQVAILNAQLDEIMDGIIEAKEADNSRITVKQLEKSKKSIQARLDKLNDEDRKDDVVTFEELGCDRIFIDEAHYYKNLFLYTKMQNISGIAQTEAKKSSDLFMKTRYLDETTGNKGTVFATGTPVSNSMAEIYTMQRYLQHDTLERMSLQHFDSWASTFGETVTAVELAPEGTGYRAKTRFARFYNLPELMTVFKGVADIKTADELDLDVPDVNYHVVSVDPSDEQREIVAEFSERAKKVRDGGVDPTIDNMLKITNDGRNLGLDQRCFDPSLPDFEGSKVNACVQNIFGLWEKHQDKRLTQLVFSDLSTPRNDGSFSVYDDIKSKLVAMGVPENEIVFIHNAKTEAQKEKLFEDVRNGDVRILIGSTQKMGAGTNVQDKLIALHDLDCPWRPADLEQRSGRIIRQGNEQDEVEIYRYVTKDTFDAYMWQLVENKQKFISQIMTSKTPVRSAEDVDTTALSYAEIKALATGNPLIKEKMDLDIKVSKLKVLKSNFLSRKYSMEDSLIKEIPYKIKSSQDRIAGLKKDVDLVSSTKPANENTISPMVINGETYTEKDKANAALKEAIKKVHSSELSQIGQYRNFKICVSYDSFFETRSVYLRGAITYKVGLSGHANIGNFDSLLVPEKFSELLQNEERTLENVYVQKANAEELVQKPFAQEEELRAATIRLNELNALLNNDKDEPTNSKADITPSDEGKQPLDDAISAAKDRVTPPAPDRQHDNNKSL